MLGGRRRRMALAAGVAGALTAMPVIAASPAVAAPAAPAIRVAPATRAAPAALADAVRDSQLWVLQMLDVQSAWNITEGAGVTVAVIDSGVDPYVSDLQGSVITGPDLTGLGTSMNNPHWGEHGTWMASIIAGHGHDGGGDGIIGVAPAARILSIRVIPDRDDPNYRTYDNEPERRIQDSLAAGIRDAVNDGAQVISMSIGYSAPSGVVRGALEYAYSRGVVLVASSGNSGHDDERRDDGFAPVSFPAEYPGVLSVGALDGDDQAASFSSNNLSVQVAAPGVRIPAQGRDGLYWTVDGTSPACALVAGVAALIKSRYPRISPALVTEALTSTAHNNPPGGYNAQTGFGTVDAAAALRAAGQLMAAHRAASQVTATAHFGGGSAAIPAAPVAPRGAGQLALFTVFAAASLALVLAAAAGLAAARRGRRARAYEGAAAYARPPAPGYYGGPDDSA